MLKWTSALALAALVEAKDVTTADGRKTRQRVGLAANEDLCIFKNYDDYWCFAATPPMVKAGWEWEQEYTETPSTDTPVVEYYQVQLKPYVQVQANIVSNLRLLNLWINNVTFDLDQFTYNLFLSLIVNENFQLCPGMGVENETILLKVLWTMKFWNCSKTLVDDLADFSSTWTGYEAKYFQDCSQSNNAEVIFYEKELRESAQDGATRGTVYAKSE